VIEWEEFEKGEDVWGPKVERALTDWESAAEAGDEEDEIEASRSTRARRNSSSEVE